MRAAILDTFGDADVLKIADIPQPEAKSGEVLIRVHASSINPVDLGVRAGKILPAEPDLFPMILGWDAAGVIDALGPDTEGFNIGDRVMAISQQPGSKVGTHADLALYLPTRLLRSPTLYRLQRRPHCR